MEDLLEKITHLLQQQEERTTSTQQAIGENLYRQLEALISITSVLPLRRPLPPMRGWAISPDFAVLLISEIMKKEPRIVLELGSGVSTLLAAYCLEKTGSGRIVSIDHDAKYCEQWRARLEEHGLDDIAEILHAPLREVQLNQQSWDWYDAAYIDPDVEIDLLVVDGPPGQIQELSRYPALPLLREHLSGDAVILLDDAGRPDEKIILDMWAREFPDLVPESVPAEKGAAVLRHAQ